MTGPGRRFDPSELDDVGGAPLSDVESAAMLGTARDLEAFAQSESIAPTSGFEDRVMAAIALEAPPRTVATGGWLGGFLVALRDAWRITLSGGGRPLAVRAQALALVVLVGVAFVSVGTLGAVGVARLLANDPTTPPTIAPSPGPSLVSPPPSLPTPSMMPSDTPSPSIAPSPSPSASPSSTAEPTETAEGTDDSGGAPRPTDTPKPTDDDETAKPTDDDDEKTPEPTETPEPTDDDSSGRGSGDDDGS